MAEPLKNHYGADVPRRIAAMIAAVHPRFKARAFLKDALDGYDALELLQRGGRIAEALARHLPPEYPDAIGILLASVEQPARQRGHNPLASFLFLPHTLFVARYGLDHFELSMQAQYRLTQCFTAEASIRPFIEKHPRRTLQQLREWANDPSEHVRRLVSEGTRPRLPWAPRLRAFQKDPGPVLGLLELLKDDPSLYVRRSVANNLNDIGKDHPELLIQTAGRWMKDASPDRQWIIRHALRSAVKRGDAGALRVLGFGQKPQVSLREVSVMPARLKKGETVRFGFEMVGRASRVQRLLVDVRVHFVKAGGKTGAKVFKLRTIELAPRATETLSMRLSLKDLTTRKHHPGVHRVEALINGQVYPLGAFELRGS